MTGFVLDGMPAVYEGRLPYSPDFLAASAALSPDTSDTPVVMYEAGLKVSPAIGADLLAAIWEPYFNREWNHFCSHHHTPPNALGPDAGALQRGRVVYFAHPIFGLYGRHGMSFYANVILAAIRSLLPDPIIRCAGPGSLHVTVNRQPAQSRTVVHLMHYIPEQRTAGAETVYDVIPLFDIPLAVCSAAPSRVYTAPELTDLPFTVEDGYVKVILPELRGHTMVVLED